MGIQDHLTCPLKNLYAGQEATIRIGHGTMVWFKLVKQYAKCILWPCLFNLFAQYIMWNARLDEAHPGIKVAGRNINNFRYADDTTLMPECEEGTKESLDESERGEWKGWPKMNNHGIWSHYFMANRWGNNDRLYFLGLQNQLQMVTAATKLKDACSMEEKLWQA